MIFIVVSTSYSQTLINALSIKPSNIELNGNKLENEFISDRMIIPFNKAKIVLYQDNDITYWGEFKYSQC